MGGGGSMALKFDLSPFDRLDDDFAKAAGKLETLVGSENTKTQAKAALKPLEDDAKSRVHSITGHLKSSIETRVTTHADAPTEIEVGISYARHPEAHHAHLVEDGHGGPHPAPPHPFWEPAVQLHGQQAVDALEDLMEDLVDQLF